MKRIVSIVAAVVIVSAYLIGCAEIENFVGDFGQIVGGEKAVYDLGNTLIIVCEYDKFMKATDEEINLIEKYQDSLSKYDKILILCTKDGSIYLAIEMPLVDGVFIKNTGNPLMSRQYLIENMQIGN